MQRQNEKKVKTINDNNGVVRSNNRDKEGDREEYSNTCREEKLITG